MERVRDEITRTGRTASEYMTYQTRSRLRAPLARA